jgi:predicted metal-dependent HD superfamily phosphohydrolase
MFVQVDTRNPAEVEAQVTSIYRRLFADAAPDFVARAFGWASDCFSGRYGDYQAIDARYHDFEHTLQGTLCLARLLHGRHVAGVAPPLTRSSFELALLAILFHDTGYLKRRGDTEGTGAKYTLTHVARSADFARELLSGHGYSGRDIEAVRNMIMCTGVNADVESLTWRSELDQILGCALATADLLGQMAAPDYVDKLPILYLEFAEAVRHDGRKAARLASYDGPDELLRNTPLFWQSYVLPRISEEFYGLHQFLNDPYPDGPNDYLRRVEANIALIQRRVSAAGR